MSTGLPPLVSIEVLHLLVGLSGSFMLSLVLLHAIVGFRLVRRLGPAALFSTVAPLLFATLAGSAPLWIALLSAAHAAVAGGDSYKTLDFAIDLTFSSTGAIAWLLALGFGNVTVLFSVAAHIGLLGSGTPSDPRPSVIP